MMRLHTKTTLFFLAALVPILVAGGLIIYDQFSKELNERMDEELITEEVQWLRYLRTQAASGTTFILQTPEIVIAPVEASVTEYPRFQTVDGFDAKENRILPFRVLSHVVDVRGTPYLISIRRSQEQREVLKFNITRIMFIVFVTLFVITLLVNWFISRLLWKPFRKSLREISNAELQKIESIRFEETNTTEFSELNASLNQMVGKIHSDYNSMKEFTENAAHEMQTPVAVVQSKLELLLQDSNLREDQVDSIIQASESLTRLSKLNQSLLLLAKIENNQFEASELVSLTAVTNKYLRLFDELIKDKQLQVQLEHTGDWSARLHPFLADSLISNLIGNAIKYNYEGGRIEIEINDGYFHLTNTSNLPEIDPAKLFKRFGTVKTNTTSSTGLGLAIVKKIADINSLTITYNYKGGLHAFLIRPLKSVGPK